MKRRSWRQAVRNPRIRMGQNWEPVLTEDKLKLALAQKAEARLTAMELENRLKELRARRLAPEDQKRSRIGARRVWSPTLDALPRINRNRVHSLPFQARKASWCPSRFGPVAPHFGQAPWNKLAPSLTNLAPLLSAERAKPPNSTVILAQLMPWT